MVAVSSLGIRVSLVPVVHCKETLGLLGPERKTYKQSIAKDGREKAGDFFPACTRSPHCSGEMWYFRPDLINCKAQCSTEFLTQNPQI